MKIILLCFLFITSAHAFLPTSFSAQYDEIHKSIISGKEKRTSGVLEYRYPGKIRLESKKEGTIFVSDGKVSWYYTAPMFKDEPGYCTIKQSLDMGVIGLFDSLRKGLKSNDQYRVENKKDKKVIIFSDVQKKQLGIDRAVLIFEKAPSFSSLVSIEIEYADGKKVLLELKKRERDKKFSKDYFVFEIPKNTKISYQ